MVLFLLNPSLREVIHNEKVMKLWTFYVRGGGGGGSLEFFRKFIQIWESDYPFKGRYKMISDHSFFYPERLPPRQLKLRTAKNLGAGSKRAHLLLEWCRLQSFRSSSLPTAQHPLARICFGQELQKHSIENVQNRVMPGKSCNFGHQVAQPEKLQNWPHQKKL